MEHICSTAPQPLAGLYGRIRAGLGGPLKGNTMNWFIAIAANTWGRGRSIDEARKELRKAGGKLRTHLVYGFEIPPGGSPPFVDEMGNTVTDAEAKGGKRGGGRQLVAATRKGKPIPAEALSSLR